MSKEKETSESKKTTTKKTTTKKKNTTNTTSKKDAVNKTNTKAKTKDTKKNIEEKKSKKEEVIKEENIEEVIDNDFDYDEDLEDGYGDDFEEEEIVEVKKESKEKETPKKDVSKDNIKKIEKMAKEKKKTRINNGSKVKDFGYFLEMHRHVISSFIAGALITTLVAFIIWPERIATLKNGTQPVVTVDGKTYTANDLYDQMKAHYSVSQLLDEIDNDLLTELYPEDDEMNEEVEATAENYINMYQQYYNYTEEEFLSASGFSSREDYLEYLKLDYRRQKYRDEYIEENLTDEEIQDYYDENVYGDINCQHILVEVASEDTSSDDSSDDSDDSNKLSDEDAKKLAQEIIDKINDGTSWEDIQEEYKDQVTFEDLGYQSWDSDLEDSFKNALKDMDDNSYSEEPVKTSYGYHVIYRIDQKKTPSLEDTKDKIIENLVEEKTNEDTNIMYKALISLRDEKNIEFSDTDMKDKYDNYKKEYE